MILLDLLLLLGRELPAGGAGLAASCAGVGRAAPARGGAASAAAEAGSEPIAATTLGGHRPAADHGEAGEQRDGGNGEPQRLTLGEHAQ